MPLLYSAKRTFSFSFAALLLGLAPAASSFAQTCPFDDGSAKLGVEGVILTRYALGMTGAALVAGTGINAADAPIVEATASCPSCGLNITGNANMTVTDATIISRKIAGLKGAALTNGLNLGSGTRNTTAAVQTFLLGGCGNVHVPATCNTNQIIKWNGDAWACADPFPVCDFGQTLSGNGFGGLQCTLPANVINTVDNAAAVGTHSAIAVMPDGLPVMAYYDSTNGDLKFLRCSTTSCSGANSISTVDSAGTVGSAPSLALDGSVARISYYDGSNGNLKVAYCINTVCSAANIYTVDSAGVVGSGSSIATNNLGRPTISYRDVSNGTVKVARCGSSDCASPVITTIEPAAAAFEGTSIALTSGGFPVVAFINTPASTTNVRVVICSDVTCTAPVTGTSGSVSSSILDQVSLALSSTGVPMWSFYDSTNGYLRFTSCFSPDCSTGTISTSPDTAGSAGLYSSIAVASDGRPVIAYYDTVLGDLKVLKCGNSQCSSKNRISTVDSAGVVGSRPSLALPRDGLPVISYYDGTNSALKVIKCANDACAP